MCTIHKNMLRFILYGYLSLVSINGMAQYLIVPKIGITLPSQPPITNQYQVDSRTGTLFGIEFRKGQKPIYFNPALYLIYNPIDVYKKPTPTLGEFNELLMSTSSVWMKVNLGFGGNIIGDKKSFNIHIRNGLSGGFLISRPDFKGEQPLTQNYRVKFMEYHCGIGMNYRRVIIDFDYHLSFVRRINHSDVVENTFALSVGYALGYTKIQKQRNRALE